MKGMSYHLWVKLSEGWNKAAIATAGSGIRDKPEAFEHGIKDYYRSFGS